MAPKNIQKTLKKPSAAPENIEKPSKNLPAAPENVEKPSKNPKKALPGDIFMSFGLQKPPKGGGARAKRAPPFWSLFGAKTFQKTFPGTVF